jgi:hypothetical protein
MTARKPCYSRHRSPNPDPHGARDARAASSLHSEWNTCPTPRVRDRSIPSMRVSAPNRLARRDSNVAARAARPDADHRKASAVLLNPSAPSHVERTVQDQSRCARAVPAMFHRCSERHSASNRLGSDLGRTLYGRGVYTRAGGTKVLLVQAVKVRCVTEERRRPGGAMRASPATPSEGVSRDDPRE